MFFDRWKKKKKKVPKTKGPLKLGQKQELFARMLPRLIDKAHDLGFECRFGEVWRTPGQARWNSEHCRFCTESKGAPIHVRGSRDEKGHTFRAIGIKQSLHCERLAVDLLLFRDGKWLTSTEDYNELGKWWLKQHDLCRWGGSWKRKDGNHFSLTHRGRA